MRYHLPVPGTQIQNKVLPLDPSIKIIGSQSVRWKRYDGAFQQHGLFPGMATPTHTETRRLPAHVFFSPHISHTLEYIVSHTKLTHK